MVSNRLEQLNTAYKKTLGAILLKLFPHQETLSVVDVLIDSSGTTGRVWLATTAEILKEVEERRGDIQRRLAERLNTRYTPRLSFILDDKYLDRIDNLFNKLSNEN